MFLKDHPVPVKVLRTLREPLIIVHQSGSAKKPVFKTEAVQSVRKGAEVLMPQGQAWALYSRGAVSEPPAAVHLPDSEPAKEAVGDSGKDSAAAG